MADKRPIRAAAKAKLPSLNTVAQEAASAVVQGVEAPARRLAHQFTSGAVDYVMRGGRPRVARRATKVNIGTAVAGGPGENPGMPGPGGVGNYFGGRVKTMVPGRAMKGGGSYAPPSMPGAAGKFESYAAADDVGKRGIAAKYFSQVLGNDVAPDELVGFPDGIGQLTSVAQARFSYPCTPVVQAGTNNRWAGFFVNPAWGPSASYSELATMDASGNMSWTARTINNAIMDSIVAAAAFMRNVSYKAGLEVASAEEVRGGYALQGHYALGISPPTALNTILSQQDAYARVDIAKSNPGKIEFASWISTMGGSDTSMQVPSSVSFSNGVVVLVRLPSLTSGVIPGDYEILNWVIDRSVEWIPALSTGALAGNSTGVSEDAREQVSNFRDYVVAETGVEFGTQLVPGAGKWLTSAWDKAKNLAARVAQAYNVAQRVGAEAGRVAQAVASTGALLKGGALPHSSPAELAAHYAAVAQGRPSPVVARLAAKFRGDDRFDQQGLEAYIEAARRFDYTQLRLPYYDIASPPKSHAELERASKSDAVLRYFTQTLLPEDDADSCAYPACPPALQDTRSERARTLKF